MTFGKHEVEYLGFRISDQGIQPSLKKVERLLRVLPPKTPSLLHTFLCGINFYRSEIPHFGHIWPIYTTWLPLKQDLWLGCL